MSIAQLPFKPVNWQILFFVKGIVSRDLQICFLVPFDRSKVPTPYRTVRLLFKSRFNVLFFDF
jgi:hypothetical protein